MKGKIRCYYAYIRVSTAQQSADGTSLDTQKKVIEDWVKRDGGKLISIEADIGVSGTLKAKERPGLAKILRNIQKGEAMLTISMSRLARNYPDAIHIIELIHDRGAHFVSVEEGYDTKTIVGNTTMQIMSSIAELQAKQVSQYAKESAEAFKRLERHTGGIPYGYKKKSPEPGSGLEEDFEQQGVILLIRTMKAEDGLSFNSIAKYLTKRGIPTPGGGKQWYANAVIRIHDRTHVNMKGRDDIKDVMNPETLVTVTRNEYDPKAVVPKLGE